MSYSNLLIKEKISSAQQSIHNARNHPALSDLLGPLSYNTEKLTVGKVITQEVQSLYNTQQKEYGDSYNATKEYQEQWVLLLEEYRDFRIIAKIVFKNNPGALKELGLHELVKRRKGELQTQISATLHNALSNDEFLNALAPYSYTTMRISGILELLLAIPDLKKSRVAEQSEAQSATRARDSRIDDLDEWMFDFLTIARVAVKNDPELMELLGDIVPFAQ